MEPAPATPLASRRRRILFATHGSCTRLPLARKLRRRLHLEGDRTLHVVFEAAHGNAERVREPTSEEGPGMVEQHEQHKGLGLHPGDLSVAIVDYRTTRLHDRSVRSSSSAVDTGLRLLGRRRLRKSAGRGRSGSRTSPSDASRLNSLSADTTGVICATGMPRSSTVIVSPLATSRR